MVTYYSTKNQKEYEERPILGVGNQVQDCVVRSILARKESSEFIAQISMWVMVILVLIGGGTSVGLWWKNHVETLRLVEAEREKLVRTNAQLLDLPKRVEDVLNLVRPLKSNGSEDSIKETIEKLELAASKFQSFNKYIENTYTDKKTYYELLKEIEHNAQTRWPDIAMRATIAVLTIFLVQIFFSVYKFNRQLSTRLSDKAEALEIVGTGTESLEKLRKDLVEVVTRDPPGFGINPRTPAEEIINAANNLTKVTQGNAKQ